MLKWPKCETKLCSTNTLPYIIDYNVFLNSIQPYLLISVKTRVPKTETNIANVSVVNLVKYISDNANPDFFSKCSPSSLLTRRYNSYTTVTPVTNQIAKSLSEYHRSKYNF